MRGLQSRPAQGALLTGHQGPHCHWGHPSHSLWKPSWGSGRPAEALVTHRPTSQPRGPQKPFAHPLRWGAHCHPGPTATGVIHLTHSGSPAGGQEACRGTRHPLPHITATWPPEALCTPPETGASLPPGAAHSSSTHLSV